MLDFRIENAQASSSNPRLALAIELPKPTTVSEVEEHNRVVCRPSADRALYRKISARCEHEEAFQPHELRRRGLRLIVEHAVLCVTIWLARWWCGNCGYVFTDYPPFRTPL